MAIHRALYALTPAGKVAAKPDYGAAKGLRRGVTVVSCSPGAAAAAAEWCPDDVAYLE